MGCLALCVLAPLGARPLVTVEDYYRLYYLTQTPKNQDHLGNLYWMQRALQAPFATPIEALVVPENEAQYRRYRTLVRLHLHYLMAETCVALGARFDKHEPRFFNRPWSDDIVKSLDVAKFYYDLAQRYWNDLLEDRKKLDADGGPRTELTFAEEIPGRIDEGQLDLTRVLDRQRAKLEKTREFFASKP